MTMNILDRAIHQVAPVWSERRQAARARVEVLQQIDKLLPGAAASASMEGGTGAASGNPSSAGGRWWRTTPRDARFDTLRHLPTRSIRCIYCRVECRQSKRRKGAGRRG